MYPLNFFGLFPPFPRENKIFVAMDFNSRFNNRWEKVIKFAVEKVTHKEKPLEPYRVDMKKGSDSIFTDILISIGNCRLFFADLTTIGLLDKRPIRNENVMYEVGIAQTVRLPEEVILFRSDNDPLPFDLANLRINYYDPDNDPNDAIEKVRDAIELAFKEINLQKHLAVSQAVESLDQISYALLLIQKNGILNLELEYPSEHPVVMSSILRLFELGILRAQYAQFTPSILWKIVNKSFSVHQLMSYKITPFGIEVLKEISDRHYPEN